MNENDNVQIKIPAKHYVGTKTDGQGTTYGSIIPEGNDQLTVKRKAAIDRWCQHGTSTSKRVIIDNFPIIGFRIKKSNGGVHRDNKTVDWYVLDPRGFQINISSVTLAYLIENCTIENGEILEKCVWGRFNSWNVLLPTSSKLYLDAVRNTARASKRTSLHKLKPGNHIITQNGLSGVFLGNHFLLTKAGWFRPDIQLTPRKVALIGEPSEDGGFSDIQIVRNLRLSEITNTATLSIDDCLGATNRHFRTHQDMGGMPYHVLVGSTLHPTIKSMTEPKFVEVDSMASIETITNNVVATLHNGERVIIPSYELTYANSKGFVYVRPYNDSGTYQFKSGQLSIADLKKCQLFYVVREIETQEGHKITVFA